MNERQWEHCNRPAEMLAVLGHKASPHKCRLFACALERLLPRLPSRVENQERENAIEVAERFADGGTTPEELAKVLRCSSGLGMWRWHRSMPSRPPNSVPTRSN
jgi:hypothetical protein